MILNHSLFSIILFTSIPCLGQTASGPSTTGHAVIVEDWSLRSSLPKVRVIPLHPTTEIKSYKKSSDSNVYEYTALAVASSKPFKTDDEAEALAKDFLSKHFPSIPLDLKTSRIFRSASGERRPTNKADQGHSIAFKVYWHGIEIDDCFVQVQLKGRKISLVKFELGTPEIVPNSDRKLISRQEAIRLWQETVVKHFKAPEGIIPKLVTLAFVWSGPDNDFDRDEKKVGNILTPNWRIKVSEHSEELLVDAYTGKVWRND